MSVEGVTALPAPWQGYSVDARSGMLDREAAWHYLSNYAYWVCVSHAAPIAPKP